MAVTIPTRVLENIWDRIDVRTHDECWPWKLSIGSHGYGQVGWAATASGPRGMTTAHRAAWTAHAGPIPDGLTIDHVCRNRVCCNPLHLRLLTNSANGRDNGMRRRTACPRGHAYSVRADSGHRRCPTCDNERNRRSRTKEAI